MAPSTLTADEVRRLLDYDPNTGVFTWRERRGGKASQGSAAGSPQTNGYIHILVHRRAYKAHRLAWLLMHGEWPQAQIDHKNRVRHDNRIANLRLASQSENSQNAARKKTNSTGVCGVSWYKRTGKWSVRLYLGGQIYWCKHFACFAQAVKARRAVETEAHPFRTP
jgi:hypothetical protein